MIANLIGLIMIGPHAGQPLPRLTVNGPDLVDPAGRRVVLRGVNVGNWFVIEPWMLNLSEGEGAVSDQFEIETILAQRFGVKKKDRLMETYRSNWIQEKDFKTIRSFGFNAIRLPLNYRQFESDDSTMKLRKDAFIWTDRVVQWAGQNGLYVILDMHGVQGGQSPYDHTGRSGQNKLWSSPPDQKRLAWLWCEVARHYRGNPAIAAYDVFNEPYGGTHEGQKSVFSLVYPAIRAVDSDTLIYAHGHTDTFTFYGKPKDNGWKNVGFEMHYYPGLFGNGEPGLMTMAKHIQRLSQVAKDVSDFGAPFLVGEMNVVFDRAGGGAMMRHIYDVHESHGWSTTMWCYKVLTKNGGHGEGSWGMVTNSDPLPRINLKSDSYESILTWIRSLGTMKIEIDQALFDAMTAKVAPQVVLPELEPVLTSVAHDDSIPGWNSVDIGGALKGGLEDMGQGRFALYGGGRDVWSGQDQFRFLSKPVTGDFELSVEIHSVADVESYSKAGIMARAGDAKDAAHAMFTVFPSGGLQAAWRKGTGDQTESAQQEMVVKFPFEMKLSRKGDSFIRQYRQTGGTWIEFARNELSLPSRLDVGVMSLSHDNGRLVRVVYSGLNLIRQSASKK